MKLLFFLFPLFIYSQTGFILLPEETMALDKQQHFAAGMYISTLSYSVTMELSKEKNKPRAMIVSLGVTSLVAAIKELSDRNTTGFSQADFYPTVSGGVFMNIIFLL